MENKISLGTVVIILIVAFSSFFVGYRYNDYQKYERKVESVTQLKTKIAPSGVIDLQNIEKYDDKLVINLKTPTLISVNKTHSWSMLPFMDERATLIGTTEYSFNDLKKGDLIAFSNKGFNTVHAVIGAGSDEQGNYLVTQGWNLYFNDNIKVREEMVLYKVTGVLYGSG